MKDATEEFILGADIAPLSHPELSATNFWSSGPSVDALESFARLKSTDFRFPHFEAGFTYSVCSRFPCCVFHICNFDICHETQQAVATPYRRRQNVWTTILVRKEQSEPIFLQNILARYFKATIKLFPAPSVTSGATRDLSPRPIHVVAAPQLA